MKPIVICTIVLCTLLTGPVSAHVPSYGNWTEITSNASFGPRYDFGTAVFNDQLWVIGGHTQEGFMGGCPATSGSTILSSADGGKTWVLDNVTTPVPQATCDMNDIWSSADGKNWDEVMSNAPFGPRSGMGVAVFHDNLWVIGGSAAGALKNDVWSSADGTNWTRVAAGAGFSPRSDMGVAVFNNRLWVMGGGNESAQKNDVWSSADGLNWTLVTANAEFNPRYGKGVIVFGNKIWMIGGTSDSAYTDAAGYTHISEGGSKDVWSSTEGKTWVLENASEPFAYQEFPPVAVADNKIWILGGGIWETMPMQTKNSPPHATNAVWSSTDGVNWTAEKGTAGFSPRFLSGVAVFRDSIWVIGGTDNDRISGDVWCMSLPESPEVALSATTSSPAPVVSGIALSTTEASPLPVVLPVAVIAVMVIVRILWGIKRGE